MRHAVLVALVIAPACGFTAKPGAGGAGDKDGAPDAPAVSSDAPPAIDAAMIDAAMIDAPIDAPPVWTTVDTLTVSCLGMTVTSTFVLQTGIMYKLHAFGECVTNTQNGSKGDPEYFGYNVGQTYDTYAGIDSGIAIDDPTPGATKNPRWGMFSAQHTYEVMWPGAGATVAAKFHSSDYSNNAGTLTLQIQALQ